MIIGKTIEDKMPLHKIIVDKNDYCQNDSGQNACIKMTFEIHVSFFLQSSTSFYKLKFKIKSH